MTDLDEKLKLFVNSFGLSMWESYKDLLEFDNPKLDALVFSYDPHRYLERYATVKVSDSASWRASILVDPGNSFLISCTGKNIEKREISSSQKEWSILSPYPIHSASISWNGIFFVTNPTPGINQKSILWRTKDGEQISEFIDSDLIIFDKFNTNIYCHNNSCFGATKLNNSVLFKSYAVFNIDFDRVYECSKNNIILGESFERNSIEILDIERAITTKRFNPRSIHKYSARITDAAIDKNYNYLVTVAQESYGSNIIIHNLLNQHYETIGVDQRTPNSVSFSPYGKAFAIGCDQGLAIWDVKLAREICLLSQDEIICVSFSNCGQYLFDIEQSGDMHFWKVRNEL